MIDGTNVVAEAGRLRRELLPPFVVGARRRGVCRQAGPEVRPRSSVRSAYDSGSAIKQRDGEHPEQHHRRAAYAPDAIPERGSSPASDEEPVREEVILQPDQPGERPLARGGGAPAGASVAELFV